MIVAPDSQCQDIREPANLKTYNSRVWTRAAQVAFFCSRGLGNMFIMAQAFERVPHDWMDDVVALFEGAMTCCTRQHVGGVCEQATNG